MNAFAVKKKSADKRVAMSMAMHGIGVLNQN